LVIFPKDIVSSGIKPAIAATISVSSSMKSPPREREVLQEPANVDDPSRDDKGKGKKICKFWKQGRCDRGNQCKFKHEKESPVVLPEPQHLHGHHRLIPKETNAGTAGALGKVGRTPRVLDDQSLQSQDPQGIKASLTLPEQVQLLCV